MTLTYTSRDPRFSSTKREALFELSREDGGFPVCRICGLSAFHTQRWNPDVPADDPKAAPRGVVHTDCQRREQAGKPARPRSRRERRARQRHIGAFRSDHPLPGGRDSPLRKKINGEVVARDFGIASRPGSSKWGDELDTTLAAVAAEMARPQ